MAVHTCVDFFSTPQSQLIYEGGQTTLTCHVEGTAFWQLNGTVYSELNTAFFKARGITSFDFFLGGSEVNKTLTIIGSVLNNNTVVNCISQPNFATTTTSEDATITVLGKYISLCHLVCLHGLKCILCQRCILFQSSLHHN